MGLSTSTQCTQGTRCNDRCDDDGEMEMDVDDDHSLMHDMFESQAISGGGVGESRGLRALWAVEDTAPAPGVVVRPGFPAAGGQDHMRQGGDNGHPSTQGLLMSSKSFFMAPVTVTRSASMVKISASPMQSSVPTVQAKGDVNGSAPSSFSVPPGPPTSASSRVDSRASALSNQSRQMTQGPIQPPYDRSRRIVQGSDGKRADEQYQQNRKDGRGSTSVMKTADMKERLKHMESMKALGSPSKDRPLTAEELHRRKD